MYTKILFISLASNITNAVELKQSEFEAEKKTIGK